MAEESDRVGAETGGCVISLPLYGRDSREASQPLTVPPLFEKTNPFFKDFTDAFDFRAIKAQASA
jgi:hypothetical protein